jgi:hypothetical protein
MNPVLAVYDNFLPEECLFRRLDLYGEFNSVVNDADGVLYEGIALNIDPMTFLAISRSLPYLVGHLSPDGTPKEIEINYMFARVMTRQTPPSEIHTDHVMGEYSLHVYMDRRQVDRSGTQFWRHQEFGDQFPNHVKTDERSHFYKSCARPSAWVRTHFVPAKFNRALLHDSKLWHSAEPSEGFGHNEHTGRIVLTTFFSRIWE